MKFRKKAGKPKNPRGVTDKASQDLLQYKKDIYRMINRKTNEDGGDERVQSRVSRKQRRKEERKLKKARKNAFHHKKPVCFTLLPSSCLS